MRVTTHYILKRNTFPGDQWNLLKNVAPKVAPSMLALLIFLKENLAKTWNSMNLHDLMVEKLHLKFWVVKNLDLQKKTHETEVLSLFGLSQLARPLLNNLLLVPVTCRQLQTIIHSQPPQKEICPTKTLVYLMSESFKFPSIQCLPVSSGICFTLPSSTVFVWAGPGHDVPRGKRPNLAPETNSFK